MKKLLILSLFLLLSACAPKTELKTVYVDKVKYVMPDLPTMMTDPVMPAKNPAKNPLEMTHNDLVKWWTELRFNLQEANQKLLKIRVWHTKQQDLVKSQQTK